MARNARRTAQDACRALMSHSVGDARTSGIAQPGRCCLPETLPGSSRILRFRITLPIKYENGVGMPQSMLERSAIATVDPNKALKGYFGIMDLWKASNAEARVILGSPSTSTFFAWKRGEQARPSDDTLRRIGYVAGIFKAL